MDLFKAHYDRFLLGLAGLLLVGIALWTALASGGLPERFTPTAVRTGGAPFAEDAAVTQLRADHSKTEAPARWGEGRGSLFVSRVYLLRGDQLVDILESDVELFPGISNAWILEHNLDYTDPGLPDADSDGDGFTNLEEFMAKTDPRDPKSKPAVWTKLRLTDSKIDKLRVKFMSLPTGSLREVSINTISSENPQELSGSTRFYRDVDGQNQIVLVETAPDGKEVDQPTPLLFERAEMRREFNPSTNVEEEIPFIYLRNTADNKEIELRRGEVKDSPYSLATLIDTRPGGQTMQLRSGETFTLDGTETYKLVDVTEEKAIIQHLESGEQHEVPTGSQPAADTGPTETIPE
jgi:hypothetical protein